MVRELMENVYVHPDVDDGSHGEWWGPDHFDADGEPKIYPPDEVADRITSPQSWGEESETSNPLTRPLPRFNEDGEQLDPNPTERDENGALILLNEQDNTPRRGRPRKDETPAPAGDDPAQGGE